MTKFLEFIGEGIEPTIAAIDWLFENLRGAVVMGLIGILIGMWVL